MPLAMAKAGDTVTIRRITGQEELRRRLTDLGFVENANVTVVSELAGCLIVQVKGSRVALDRGMANQILV